MAGFTNFTLPDRIDGHAPPEGLANAEYLNALASFAESKADLVGTCHFSNVAPTAADGVIGQRWHNSVTNLMYVKTGSSTWSVGTLFGESGADGNDGADGTSYNHYVASTAPATLEPGAVYFVRGTPTPVSYSTAGGRTITAADLLAAIMVRDCNGGNRTDTLPTAALMVAAVTNPVVGLQINCAIINGSDAAETLTIAAGTGGSFDSNQTAATRVIAQGVTKVLRLRLTNIGSGTQTYRVYL